MRRSHHEAWVKVLACCFIVVAIMCVVFAVVLANVDGEDGADGITITDVQKTTEGNVDTYTVYYSDDTTYSFTVTNGINGADGNGIEDISSATSADGLTVTYTITYTSGGTYVFDVTNGNEIEDVTSVIDESASTITYTFTMTDGSTQTSTVSYTPYITDVTVNSDGTITLTYSGNATGTTADGSSGTTIYTKTIDDVKSVSSIVRNGRYIYVISSNSSDNVNTDNITVGNYAYTVDLCCVHEWTKIDDLADKSGLSVADQNLISTDSTCTSTGVTYYYCSDCGAIKTEITAMSAHNYDTANKTLISNNGYEELYAVQCSVCGEYHIMEKTSLAFIAGGSLASAKASSLGNSASLASARLTSSDIEYYVVSRGTYLGANPVIPSTYNGKPVYVVENFSDSTYTTTDKITVGTQTVEFAYSALESITIPDSVTKIKENAFASCASLSSIEIPDSVTAIGASAFSGCTSLSSIEIPDSVTTIGASAFKGCTSLESITLPFVGNTANASTASETTLFGYIFGTSYYGGSTETTQKYGSNSSYSATYYIPTSLTTVTITGAGSSSLLYGAFYGCTTLTTAKIDSSITTMGTYAFYNCSALTGVYYNGTSSDWASITFTGGGQANPLYYAKNLYINDTLVTAISLENITSVNSYAFYNCTSLTSVTIGSGITTIGTYSFYGCSKVESINIPSTVTTINSYAFDYCSAMETLTFDSTQALKSIQTYAFGNCYLLKEIVVPNCVISLGVNVFYNCCALESITLPFVGTSAYGINALFGCLFGGQSSISGMTRITQYYRNTNSTSNITYQIYMPSSLSEVTITGGTYVGRGAFRNCTMVKKINLPDTITRYYEYAFYNSGLTEFETSKNLTMIGDYAFGNCTSLKNLTLNGVSGSGNFDLGENAFNNCTSLTELYYNIEWYSYLDLSEEMPTYFDSCGEDSSSFIIYIGTNVQYLENSLFKNCYATSVIFQGTALTRINGYTFGNCTKLKTITIPSSVTGLIDTAFIGCTSLMSIAVDSGNTTYKAIDGNLYSYTTSSLKLMVYCQGNGTTNVSISDETTEIGSYAFYNYTTLESITIPDKVTSIGSSAFYKCTSLESITFPDGLKTISTNAFYYCTGLTSITIPANVTSIASSAFAMCKNVEAITVDSNNTTYKVVNNALCNYNETTILFYAAASTGTSYTIADTVTTISSYAFYGASKLTSITIGSAVTSIGDYAFNGTHISTIVIPASVTYIGYEAFGGTSAYLGTATFEDTTSTWRIYELKWTSSGYDEVYGLTAYTPTDSDTNVENLTSEWSSYYWKKNS